MSTRKSISSSDYKYIVRVTFIFYAINKCKCSLRPIYKVSKFLLLFTQVRKKEGTFYTFPLCLSPSHLFRSTISLRASSVPLQPTHPCQAPYPHINMTYETKYGWKLELSDFFELNFRCELLLRMHGK